MNTNREPINPDDPDLTAYSLGELGAAERREFEAKLESSPAAREELESMEEVMSLLSVGLKKEWSDEVTDGDPSLEVLPSVADDVEEKMVVGEFGPKRRIVGVVAAAAAAVTLLAVGLVSFRNVPTGTEVATGDRIEKEMSVASVGGVHVPELVLGNEVEELGDMPLSEAIANLESLEAPVDASYLEADAVVPASRRAGVAGVTLASAGKNRVDSYLPPVTAGESERSGLIERRVERSGHEFGADGGSSSRILVRGYIPFDEAANPTSSSAGRVLVGFRPVAMSGNPVHAGEEDLRYMAELQEVQNEIIQLSRQFPEGSHERAELSRLIERNRAAISGLRTQFSQ